jgi:hypothetical protein
VAGSTRGAEIQDEKKPHGAMGLFAQAEGTPPTSSHSGSLAAAQAHAQTGKTEAEKGQGTGFRHRKSCTTIQGSLANQRAFAISGERITTTTHQLIRFRHCRVDVGIEAE